MFGSEEMPTKERTGLTLRYVKYSVGFLPQVMTEDLMPCSESFSISRSTVRC